MEAHLIHFVATGMGGMLATIALVWKVWVVPAHDREVNLAKWQAGMEARMQSGERAFAAAKGRDDEIIKRLDGIEERLRHIEISMGGKHASIHEARFSGIAVFTGERLENGNRHAAFIDFDQAPPVLLGSLVQSNADRGTPWWADEDLQEHIGGPYTSDGDDAHEAVEAVRKLLGGKHE